MQSTRSRGGIIILGFLIGSSSLVKKLQSLTALIGSMHLLHRFDKLERKTYWLYLNLKIIFRLMKFLVTLSCGYSLWWMGPVWMSGMCLELNEILKQV